MKLSNKTFQEPIADELTKRRIRRRITGRRRKIRLTYDCMSAIVVGDSVVCKWGHKFKRVGLRGKEGMSLLSILRGMSSSVCQTCKDYNGETDE